MPVHIMTFNTQHCNNYLEQRIDFDIMAKAIIDCKADVVGLNEMRGEGACEDYTAQTETLAKLTGMPYYYFAKAVQFAGGPYGNALLSKLPILSAQTHIIEDPSPRKYNGYYETRCLLKAQLQGGVTILACHFGLNPDEQENAVKCILQNLPHEKCVLMGDFNAPPEAPVLQPIFERMKDTASLFPGPRLSFPSDKPSVKIDYIFVSPDVEVISADIPAIVASDHRPHIAEVKL